jgi:membrane protein DedA with SNARE-associated domain
MTLETILTILITPFLGNFFYPIALIGSIISGNIFVLFLSTLAGQGSLSIFKVWIMALAGTLIADTIWYNLGKTNFINKIARDRRTIYNFYTIKKALTKSQEKNNFTVFLVSKFIYGMRVLTLMYAGRRHMHADHFIKYNYTATTIWVTFIVSIGFLAGKGFTKLFEIFNSMIQTIATFLIILAIIYLIWYFLGKAFINRLKKLNEKVGDKILIPKMKFHKFKNRFS